MAIQIDLNKSQLVDLKAILDLGPDVLGAVVDRIERLQPAPIALAELQSAIQELIGIGVKPTLVDAILSIILDQQRPDELIQALRQMVVSLRSHSSNSPPEVVLESFEGFVDQVEGDTAHVRLKSREHGDVLFGVYPTLQLLEKGIEEQGRFLCKTVKVDGTTRIDIQAIPRVPATDEQLRAIEEEIDRVLPRDDPGIEY